MPLSSWLKGLVSRVAPARPRVVHRSHTRTLIEPVEPRLLLSGGLVSHPTGIQQLGAAGYTLNSAPDDRFTNTPVALFVDTATSSTVKNFTATIDWGDDTADTNGNIVRNPNDGTFYVLGTHRYADAGTFSTSITITHTDGRTATAAGAAFISDTTFNATTDFPGTENPNGVWTYGSDVEGFIPYGDNLTESGLVGWGDFDEGESEPNFLYNPTTADVTFAGVTYRPGQLAFTPGEFGERSILRFTAPTSGVYHFTAVFRGLDNASANVEISSGKASFLDATVTGSGLGSTQFFAAPVSLTSGDTIFFSVGYGSNQSNAGDTLSLDVRVTEITQVPTLFGTGTALNATAGVEIQDQLVATFFDSLGESSQTSFTATIRWGDGTRSTGNVTATGTAGQFQVLGSHTYKTAGNYTVTVRLRHTDGRTAEAVGVAVIEGGRTFRARGINVVAIEGLRTARVRVATFTDSRTNAVADDYTAQISWGDKTSSTGRVILGRRGRFVVRGQHTYDRPGTYPVNVTIVDNNDNTLQPTSSASVVDAPKIPLTESLDFTTGEDFSGVVFSFIDVNPLAQASLFSGEIDWGDGSPLGEGTAQSAGRGRFDLLASSHAYASPGTYTIRVRLLDNDVPGGTYRIRARVTGTATPPQQV